MIFDYNPITGLNYYSCEEEVLFVNTDYSPRNLSMVELIEKWIRTEDVVSLQGWLNTPIYSEGTYFPIYSNIPYKLD